MSNPILSIEIIDKNRDERKAVPDCPHCDLIGQEYVKLVRRLGRICDALDAKGKQVMRETK